MLIGWPSELSRLSGGAAICGVAMLPRKCGFDASELDEPPQAATPIASAALAMTTATGALRRGPIRRLISAEAPQSSVKTATFGSAVNRHARACDSTPHADRGTEPGGGAFTAGAEGHAGERLRPPR